MTGRAAERDERLHRSAASVGVLTGATNRRAFLDGAERMLCDGAELSRIVFGLDRFKAMNDTPPVLMDRHSGYRNPPFSARPDLNLNRP
jgi:GGDEF domain-containing protein